MAISGSDSAFQQDLPAVVVAQGLHKRYANSQVSAVEQLDLIVHRGEFFGLLGPNGAGKTTTISMLSGLLRPDRGALSLFGLSYAKDARAIQTRIGLAPQEIALYAKLSAYENLLFFGRLFCLGRNELRARIHQALDFAQLSAKSRHPVSTYSGGMKRRLNLAVALLNAPDLLFLDEPTAGVDTQSRRLIHDQLLQLQSQGLTLIYTTHYMEEAQQLCSNIAILDQGRILRQGSPQLLLAQSGCHNLEQLFLQLTGVELREP